MSATFKVKLQKDFTVMSNHHLKNRELSLKAKGLHSLMLSLPDDWNYTLRGLVTLSKDGRDGVLAALQELEENGYLIREQKRIGGKYSKTEYTIFQLPQTEKPYTAKPCTEKPYTAKPCTENPTQSNTNKSNTKEIKDQSINHQSNSKHTSTRVSKNVENYNIIVEDVKEQIEYDVLITRYSRERIDELVSIIAEIYMTPEGEPITISCHKLDDNMVKNMFRKLNCEHIEYALECTEEMSKRQKIHNIKSYLRTTLYNAPSTINTYYAANYNYDIHNSDD